MRKELDLPAVLVMLVLCLVWGLQQTAIKAIAEQVDPLLQIGWRSLLAAGLLYGLARWRGIRCLGRDQTLIPGLLAGSLFALEFLCMAVGLKYTSAAHMVVFIYTAPLFAACGLHWLVPGERLSGRQWLGMLLAASGVICAFLIGKPSGGTSWLGDLIGLAGGAAWGATTVLIRRSALAEAPPLRTLFYQLGVTGVVLLALALPLGKRLDLAGLDSLAWSSLAFQVFIVAGISLLGWFVLLSRYRAAPLGVLTLLTPLFGVLMGVWLLGETPGPGFLAGAALVLSGLLIVSYPSRSRVASR